LAGFWPQDSGPNNPETSSQYLFIKALQHYRWSLCLTSQNQLNNSIDMTNNEVLMPIAIIGSFGASIYFFAKVMTDYILKKKMIEKGFVNDDTQAIFKQHTSSGKYTSLKWGLIIFFAGLSLVTMEFIPAAPDSPLPYGLFAVSVSLGFLIYYFILKREVNK
jgi:hypothetical protein